jgi:hypothetical protein
MRRVALYVRRSPGCSAFACARAIGPHGSTQFGYRAIHRAMRAGLIVNVSANPSRYILRVTT